MSDARFQLLDRLARYATDSPSHLAFREIAGGRAITYGELLEAIEELTRELRSAFPPGSVLMLKIGNTCDFPIAFLAVLDAGHSVFPVSCEVTEHEFDRAATGAGAIGVIREGCKVAHLARETASGCVGASPAMLLQSSGTMGLPKIVRRNAAALDAVARNCADAVGFTSHDQVLQCVPLCHSYGVEHGLLAPIFAGSTVHLAQGFDLNLVRRELRESQITLFPAVPSIYEMLANLPGDAGELRHLRVAYSAGGPLPASVFERLRDHDNLSVGQLYGATEFGSCTFSHPDAPDFAPSSVGKPMQNVDAKIDKSGQLLIRAESMMSGYLDGPSPFTNDGYFPTGDLSRVDASGNIFITGRLKLLIDVGGLKVNPLEVEQTLCEHPRVAKCIVLPVQLSETVARLKAVIIPADPAHPPAGEELRHFARGRLTPHKVPRIFEIRQSLPSSPTGKILRHLVEA